MSALPSIACNVTASLQDGKYAIPFRLDISVNGTTGVGKLYNGSEDFETTTSASIENSEVKLNFEHYLTSIDAKLINGELDRS